MLDRLLQGQRALIYPRLLGRHRALARAPEDVVVYSRALPELGRRAHVEAWLLPPLTRTAERAPLLVFAHGNSELIDDWSHELRPYRALGFALLLPEYRGYGRSGGAPSEQALASDVVYFLEQARERPDIDPERVVFHGRSLGGGVLGAALARVNPECFILESTFSSLSQVVSDLGLPASLLLDTYRTSEALARYAGRALILHGRRDRLVRYQHAERLLAAARRGTLESFDCGHNDLPRDEHYWRCLARFVGPG
jgi:pimeloyl-ACP methyl ester carboxylesterase